MTKVGYRIRHKASGKFLVLAQELVFSDTSNRWYAGTGTIRYRLTHFRVNESPWETPDLSKAQALANKRNLNWDVATEESPVQPYLPEHLEIVQIMTAETVML